MTVELRHATSGMIIDAHIPDDLALALQEQWSRSEASAHIDGFQARVTQALIDLLQSSIDWDLHAPTQKQCGLAAVIARKLSVSVPPNARRFRGAMAEFLGEYAPQLNATTSGLRGTAVTKPSSEHHWSDSDRLDEETP